MSARRLGGKCTLACTHISFLSVSPLFLLLLAAIALDPAMSEKMKYLAEDLTPRDRALSMLF